MLSGILDWLRRLEIRMTGNDQWRVVPKTMSFNEEPEMIARRYNPETKQWEERDLTNQEWAALYRRRDQHEKDEDEGRIW